MSSPISSAFKSTTHRQVLTDDAPAPFYLFPESIRSKGNSAKFDQDAFVFQYWPETLESNYNVEYGQRSVFGGTHPLFQQLKKAQRGLLGSTGIKWNFTKFLIGPDGEIVARFGPGTKPEQIAARIEALLPATAANA